MAFGINKSIQETEIHITFLWHLRSLKNQNSTGESLIESV